MEKLSQLPVPLKKSSQLDARHAEVDMPTTPSAHSSRGSVSESTRGRASSSRSNSSSYNSALQSLVSGCRSPRKSGSAGRHLADDYVITGGNRRASNVSAAGDPPRSPLVGLGGRVIGTSSCGDCTPEVSRRAVDETGNRKKSFGLRDKKPKSPKSSCGRNESALAFSSLTAEIERPSVLSRLTNRHPVKSKKAAALPTDVQTSTRLNGAANCYETSNFDSTSRTLSSKACSHTTYSYLEPTFGDHRRNYGDITCQQINAMTSFSTEQCSGDFGSPRGDIPPTPNGAGDDMQKHRCDSNTGSSSTGGGSPIYHELDPPGGTTAGDGIYRFPQSASALQHTYQSIAEISEELNALRMKSAEQVALVDSMKRAETMDRKARNLSVDDQLLIGSCGAKNASSAKKKQQQQLSRGPLSPGPMSSGVSRLMDEMATLPRAKSVQDLGHRSSPTVTSAIAADAASKSSGLQKQTPKLSIFSRIRFTKKTPSNNSSSATSTKSGACRLATTVSSSTTPVPVENSNVTPRYRYDADSGSAILSTSLDNSRDKPSFSTFTGRTSSHRRVNTANRLEHESAPDEQYSAVYVPQRPVVPPPRNSSLSPASDSRRARQSRDVARTAARDVPSPAGVALSVPSQIGVSSSTGSDVSAEPLYRKKFLKIASTSATLQCESSFVVQQSGSRIQSSSSLGNLPLVATSSDLQCSRSPVIGPSTGGNVFPLRISSCTSMTPEMATARRLAAQTPSGGDYSTTNDATSVPAFRYDLYGSFGRNGGDGHDYCSGDATPSRAQNLAGGVRRAAGLSPIRVGPFASPSCGVRMAEMRVVARRLTAISGESGGPCHSPSCSTESPACPSPRWVTSNHVPTPIPSPGPGLVGSRRLPVFQFHFPASDASSGCSSPNHFVREFRDQSSQTQITLEPSVDPVKSSNVLATMPDESSLSAAGTGPLNRRQMQTIEEEDHVESPEIPTREIGDAPETTTLDDAPRNVADESIATDCDCKRATKVSEGSTPEEEHSTEVRRASISSDKSAARRNFSTTSTSSTSTSVPDAHMPIESEIPSSRSSTKLKLPSSPLSVTSSRMSRDSRRPLADRTAAASSEAPTVETGRVSQPSRPATVGSQSVSTTPAARRRADTANGSGGNDQTPTRRRLAATGSSRLSRSPAAASSRSEPLADGACTPPGRVRTGSIGSATAGTPGPLSTTSFGRGHATVGDRRKQASNEELTVVPQRGGGRERNDVTPNLVDDHSSNGNSTTTIGDPVDSVIPVRSRVAAWSKPTMAGCSSVSSSSNGSLASAGADSESDGMPAPTSDQPDQTTHGEHLSSVNLGGRRLLLDKSEQSSKENRLATALLRVEQGTLSEKTRLLLAKISVARSAANDINRESGHVVMSTANQ